MSTENIEKQLAEIKEQFVSIDKRFDSIDKRFDAVDKRFDAVDRRLSTVDDELTAARIRDKGVEQALNDAKIRDEAAHELLEFSLEAREGLRESMHERFTAVEKKHDEEISLLKDVLHHVAGTRPRG